jgi:hypothetical protein
MTEYEGVLKDAIRIINWAGAAKVRITQTGGYYGGDIAWTVEESGS